MEQFGSWSNNSQYCSESETRSSSEGIGASSMSSSSASNFHSSGYFEKQEMNARVLSRIESTVVELLRDLCESRLPVLKHIRQEKILAIRGGSDVDSSKKERQQESTLVQAEFNKENNNNKNNNEIGGIDLAGGIGEVVVAEAEVAKSDEVMTKIKFEKEGSQKKFTIIMNLMAKVYSLVLKGQTCTKRDLFYENVPLYGTQDRLEKGLQDLCLILKVPRSAIGVTATAKGLIAGSLIYTDANGVDVDVSQSRSGLLIPNVGEGISDIRSNAKFILLVEKDAVFQRFIGECIFETMEPMIMITGKGYPDFGTRKLIQVLSKMLKIPVLALVDCDPHGIEIAAIVKWGSYGQANLARCTDDIYAQELIVPDLVWVGLRPSDIDSLNLRKASVEMNEKDARKLDSVKKRLNGQPDAEEWCAQIEILKSLQVKTELESLFSCGFRFATQTYLRSKVDELLKTKKK